MIFIILPLLIWASFEVGCRYLAAYAVALQSVAAVIFAWSVVSRHGLHTGENLLEKLKSRLVEFPLFKMPKNEPILITTSTLTLNSGEGTVSVAQRDPSTFKSIEEVVEYLNEQVKDLDSRISKGDKELRNQQIKKGKNLAAKISKNRQQINHLERSVNSLTTSGAFVELFGALCLILGLILTVIQ